MYDVSNIGVWKFKMSAYLKALGLHVYLVTTNKSYLGSDKYIEANTQALEALKHTKQRLFIYDFSLWFRFCSVKHIDIFHTFWRENQEEMNPSKRATWSKGMTLLR